ncbi:sigma 54-interacting transcriptional regulator [Sporolactobacillus nakayamae]|uniref:Transcriptional regulatory protein LevR, contains PRD, AAA+ and EIIA domains n=1 Tax=Sporolactobacillus nakayamae TaxID=269670 RepID=A0A1I2TFU0_9BACL|nr:sigma 54-interacting transcriptional regulator [Sporolactobacillus nakayamae]SFG63735.1 Transcriptional regulatory protein LevR, contains PRD, AAA+ and EIIA domains [Sporolactobacillus nakayamae]
MSVKDEIKKLIAYNTQKLDEDNSDVFTAGYVCKNLHIQRNTASHYLNELFKQGLLIKINTRPVLFLDKHILEDKYSLELSKQYENVNELMESFSSTPNHSIFSKVTGANGSLHNQIEQLKAAAGYPVNGLPVLLAGPTGVGKSYLAYIFYQYCIQMGYLTSNGKFVHLNCSEYSDNPELLSSILFGYVKGAFTGAKTDKKGLFDEADNGMLFLDEVHRLDSKGQEKLFSYLDRGTVSSLGSTGLNRKVNVRLVMATTEDIKSNFLQTFIRRIPIHVKIPSLLSRPKNELEQLLLAFYKSESMKVDRALEISPQVKHALMQANYANNIGDLKNFVTLSVANALVNLREGKTIGNSIKIDLSCLPTELRVQEIATPQSSETNSTSIVINKNSEISQLSEHCRIQLQINNTLKELDQLIRSDSTTRQQLLDKINTLTDFLESDDLISLETDQYAFLNRGITWILDSFKEQFHVDFIGNLSSELAKYLYLRNFYVFRNQISQMIGAITLEHFLNTFEKKLLIFFLRLLNNTLNYEADIIDRIVIAVYLTSAVLSNEAPTIRCVLIAHGRSTASSMAEVANRLVGRSVVDALDMPFDLKPTDIGRELSKFISQREFLQGLILLVDMGSLTEINSQISVDVDFPIGLVTNTSTAIALEVAESIENHKNIEHILEAVKQEEHIKTSLIYPQRVKKNIIIVCCATGQGTASKIKHLLTESFPRDMKVEVFPYDEKQLENKSIREMILTSYHCMAVVGTMNPSLPDTPFISLESLISGNSFDYLASILSPADDQEATELSENIVRNFTIERVLSLLTILDAHTIMRAIELFMHKYTSVTNKSLDNKTKVALYVHISSLVERLIRNEPIENYGDLNGLIREHQPELRNIKAAFSVIEEMYSVKVPTTELAYIYDLLDKVPQQQ